MNIFVRNVRWSFVFLPWLMAACTSGRSFPEAAQMIHDFDQGTLVNYLGGESGIWNLDPSDINNSWTDADIVEINGPGGKPARVLKLSYSVDSDKPAQNGFWTKLQGVDASLYDHLEIVLRGDARDGFPARFKIFIKKCKGALCTGDPLTDDVLKGVAIIPVTDQWATVRIALNRVTGILDFSESETWKNPAIARKDLDELVIVFQDRMLTQKTGTIYIDQMRFVRTGRPGPSAIDLPPRSVRKTPQWMEGPAYAAFLIKRLKGFPEKALVKKEFPADDHAFLREIAKDTWEFFDQVLDQEHGLPIDTIQIASGEKAFGDETWIGDYTNVTNVGIYLMCVVSAFDLGFISREDAVARIQHTVQSVEKLPHHPSGFPYNYYDTTTAERTSYFVSLVDSAWLLAGYYVARNAFPEELGEILDRAIRRGDLGFFYDPTERQFYHGFYEQLEVFSDYHYGTFYTEPRIASYMAIARGEVPEEHWFLGLVRTFPESFVWQTQKPIGREDRTVRGWTYPGGYYEWNGIRFVPSWGGSAFEAFMPTLALREKELAPRGLGANDQSHAEGQMRYAIETLQMPVWGMSPSAMPGGGYGEFGAKPFGSKGYPDGVVSPHASFLALEFIPQAVIRNLRKMLERYEIYGEYGFYDAVEPASGQVARKYLALDQGMILIAINNYLNEGAIRRRFHADPGMKKAEFLLTEETLFPPPAATAAAVADPG
ncbi:MAG: glucoamylase family protein [Candidatus Omnitrophota bacterium]